MTTIKNVAIAGASGNVGEPILKALINSAKFNITVLKREGSAATFPEGIKVIEVDYASLDSLIPALSGQDAVVSTLATMASAVQQTLIDAAIAAKVKRFIPSEFGSNLDNALTRALPVFTGKVQVQDYIIKKHASSDMSYTFVYNSAFLDWGLENNFIIKLSDSKVTLIDGGDLPFSATSLASVAQSVVGVLSHPDETKNRAVYVSDIVVTQKKLLALAKKAAPERKWETTVVSLDDLTAVADARLKKQLYDSETFFPYLFRAILDPNYGGVFEKNDNKLLGVKGKTEADVEEILKGLLK